MLFDDIGSYPLPRGVTRGWIEDVVRGEDPVERERFYEILKNAMWQKIEAGVEVPNYPQFQDMVSQFFSPISDEDKVEEPLLIREGEAKIIEMEAVEEVAREYKERTGEKLSVRICVTGPVELYYRKFSPPVYIDILSNIAMSIGRFIKRTIEDVRDCEVKVISIDEPSMGIDPRIGEEGIVTALELASKYAYKRNIDVQIHLHSPILYKAISQVESITVIGMESASNPSFLRLIEKKDLERDDKWLRVGISRTDIFNMAADFNEKYNVNVFEDESLLRKLIEEYNSPREIKRRLDKAFSIFGERIRYVGPDCGLGSFPDQKIAYEVLRNTAIALNLFRNKAF
ncbi:MAG: methionine synthase [Candidatus Methanospirareceae archaeon]